jgi:hypothetical protein
LSRTRPTCGTGQSRYAPRRRRRLQRRRHQTWQVSPHVSQGPAGRDLPPAACGVFPAGRGASPAGRGASPRERGPNPSRSWASDKTSPSRALLLSSPRAAGVAGMKKGICFLSGQSPSRSWAFLLHSSPDSHGPYFFLPRTEGNRGAYKRFREEGDKHCEKQRAQSEARTLPVQKSCEDSAI